MEDDLDNFRLKEPQIYTDSESVKTEGMLNPEYSITSTVTRDPMRLNQESVHWG